MSKKNYVSKLVMAVILLTALILSMRSRGPLFACSNYDVVVLADSPIGYWMLDKEFTGDASNHGLIGAYHGSDRGQGTLPNGETATIFNGTDNYFEIPDNDYLEVTKTGILTIEAWMQPDVLDFPVSERGYVHWMGKGMSGNHLWVARMYNYSQTDRPNRISGYCFNLIGGEGAGSYFQDPINVGKWIHYALVINTINKTPTYPAGYTKIFKNGVMRDQDSLKDYSIVPGNGSAPMRVGTRDMNSFFKGAIGKVAIYDYELTPEQLTAHYQAMGSPAP